MALTGVALAAKLYWRWCKEQDKSWAKILSQKYFQGIPQLEMPRYPLLGKGSRFHENGWTRVSDFKSFSSRGQLEVAGWKSPDEWPNVGMPEECVELHNVLSSRRCNPLQYDDVLAWSPNPKGEYTVASGYRELLSHRVDGDEIQWWKKIWNKSSWPKCNCFVWILAWNKCLTWDNIQKHGFQGPSIYVLCGANEEDLAHLFFRCPFSLQIWHFWWGVWNSPCVHASSLIEFWQRLGRPPSMASFL
ncbi:uncharacterized protein LOC131856346 [Cryptomeria japonica]|uniref:uncharacterized protein LOC131856346 n=1 Tax=Cryptomeria japonica TaxID=3369 RepID=UPI0027DA249D|nr:uncharacterized protein LOC131856346 [Cryptomeria japonica]